VRGPLLLPALAVALPQSPCDSTECYRPIRCPFDEVTSQAPIQIAALVSDLVIGLVGYPRFAKRPLGWKERAHQ